MQTGGIVAGSRCHHTLKHALAQAQVQAECEALTILQGRGQLCQRLKNQQILAAMLKT